MGQNRRDRSKIATGSLVGAGVFVAGFVITVLTVLMELNREALFITEVISSGDGSVLDGFLFSHLYIHEIGIADSNFLSNLFPFTLVMIVLHVVGGAVASRQAGGGVASGASIVVGFGGMTALSILYLVLSIGVSSEFIVTLSTVGIFYPVGFGGLGGLIVR